ncbi:hypothetical protein C8R45DRAFT_1221156 [Mycena sanguinolenta]|nr:hypothetical protein C8R45DRAFT_1221156 [Mycena sanguinolenta]
MAVLATSLPRTSSYTVLVFSLTGPCPPGAPAMAEMLQQTAILTLSQQLEGTILTEDQSRMQLSITGGQGGPGGQGHSHGTGGTGGPGMGPTVNITAQQLTLSTLASEQASQQGKIRAAQIGNHCPPPSRIFQGRKDILKQMHVFFTSNTGTQKIYVLNGLGGAGKTQIALKFARESSSCFSEIFFIDTSTIATIDTGFKNIAVMKSAGDSLQEGLLWLTSQVQAWLLIFDSADDPNINLQEYIPECDHGNIIITSRNPGLCVYAGSDSLVSDMEEQDGIALLLKSAAQKVTAATEQSAAEIVKALFCLPLAIVQAGAFISKSRNLGNYLELYEKNQACLLSEKPVQFQDRYKQTVYTTWQMSFDKLSPPAATLLQHCSFLHFNGISEEIFRYASEYQFYHNDPSKEEFEKVLELLSHFLDQTGEWDSLQFTFAMNEIQAYSLISFDGETKLFSVHPLVHPWGQATILNTERCMVNVGTLLGMTLSERPEKDSVLPSTILCPHVELAVNNGAHLALRFRSCYGWFFNEAGKYEQSAEMLEAVLEEEKQHLGDEHSSTLVTMNQLGTVYSNLGRYQEAEDLQVIVLEKQKQVLGDGHPDTLLTMGNLASTYSKLGEYKKAEDLEVTVLEKRKQVLSDDHRDTLIAMGNLARTYSDLGQYKEAKELETAVLEKRKQILGNNHPETLHAMSNLGSTYSHLGEYKEAKELETAVLETRKQILGDNHPDTLLAMANLASLYSNLGDYEEAKELETTVLEKRKQILGKNHPHTLRVMANLARTNSHFGEYKKAKDLEITVFEKRKQILGDNHPDTLHSMANLANTYADCREYEKAKELGAGVLEKRKQILGDNHPDTVVAMGNLACIYSNCGEYEKGKQLATDVVEKQRQILGDNHPHTLFAMGNLAAIYSALGEYEEAKELETNVLEKHKEILGDNHPETLLSMGNLGRTYSTLGQYEEAKELETAVLERRKQLLGNNHPGTLLAMANLGSTYSHLGEYEQAKELERAVLETQKQILGDNHPDTLISMGNLAKTYSALGKHRKAKNLQVIVFKKQTQLLGNDHPDTLIAMRDLAETYSDLGKHRKAKDINIIVLEKWKQLLGDDHPDTLIAMHNLAKTYSDLGKHRKAKDLNIIVLEKRKQVLGGTHPDTLLAMANLATTYWHLAEYQKAADLEIIVLENRLDTGDILRVALVFAPSKEAATAIDIDRRRRIGRVLEATRPGFPPCILDRSLRASSFAADIPSPTLPLHRLRLIPVSISMLQDSVDADVDAVAFLVVWIPYGLFKVQRLVLSLDALYHHRCKPPEFGLCCFASFGGPTPAMQRRPRLCARARLLCLGLLTGLTNAERGVPTSSSSAQRSTLLPSSSDALPSHGELKHRSLSDSSSTLRPRHPPPRVLIDIPASPRLSRFSLGGDGFGWTVEKLARLASSNSAHILRSRDGTTPALIRGRPRPRPRSSPLAAALAPLTLTLIFIGVRVWSSSRFKLSLPLPTAHRPDPGRCRGSPLPRARLHPAFPRSHRRSRVRVRVSRIFPWVQNGLPASPRPCPKITLDSGIDDVRHEIIYWNSPTANSSSRPPISPYFAPAAAHAQGKADAAAVWTCVVLVSSSAGNAFEDDCMHVVATMPPPFGLTAVAPRASGWGRSSSRLESAAAAIHAHKADDTLHGVVFLDEFSVRQPPTLPRYPIPLSQICAAPVPRCGELYLQPPSARTRRPTLRCVLESPHSILGLSMSPSCAACPSLRDPYLKLPPPFTRTRAYSTHTRLFLHPLIIPPSAPAPVACAVPQPLLTLLLSVGFGAVLHPLASPLA